MRFFSSRVWSGAILLATSIFGGASYANISGSYCMGPWDDETACNNLSAGAALSEIQIICGVDHVSSYSSQSCAYYEAPMFNLDDADSANAVSTATCPPTGYPNGIYNIVEYECDH